MTRLATRRTRVLRVLAAALAGSVLLGGCDFDVYKLPLPGGADVGANPTKITVIFSDVLDLVPKSSVKVNDVTVGQVTDIDLEGYAARVQLEFNDDVTLPDNAVAEIRQTSLLGEKFVELAAPLSGASASTLASGDVIGLDRTGRNPEVEEVLGALSLVLNGGGVAQLKTIAAELNNALEGREDSARSVLTQIESFTGNLADNKDDIVDAIEALNRLSISVQAQQPKIDEALDELPSALVSLDRQRDDLVKMLQALSELGDVGVRVIKASKDATIETIRQLQPTLTELAASGDSFVKAFNVFLTYPFVDEVVGRDPQVARNLHMGDYTNLSVELDLDLSGGVTGIPTALPTLLPTNLDPTAVLDNITKCLMSADIGSKACVKVLSNLQSLLALKDECAKPENKNAVVCTVINQIPGLPALPGGGLPALPGLDDLTSGLTGSLGGLLGGQGGLFRPGIGYVDPQRGPTMRQLSQAFDPTLVDLLVPGMVLK